MFLIPNLITFHNKIQKHYCSQLFQSRFIDASIVLGAHKVPHKINKLHLQQAARIIHIVIVLELFLPPTLLLYLHNRKLIAQRLIPNLIPYLSSIFFVLPNQYSVRNLQPPSYNCHHDEKDNQSQERIVAFAQIVFKILTQSDTNDDENGC